MDSTALNYDPTAIVDDGSCIAFVYGCTDSTALNYNPNANTDDGTCIPFIYGCIDSTATNYDLIANTDDGSCTYCYATANIGADTITACDSALISSNIITNGTYLWNSSNISPSFSLYIFMYGVTPNRLDTEKYPFKRFVDGGTKISKLCFLIIFIIIWQDSPIHLR